MYYVHYKHLYVFGKMSLYNLLTLKHDSIIDTEDKEVVSRREEGGGMREVGEGDYKRS